jgi:dTDP-glucose 4,6-dehydratase
MSSLHSEPRYIFAQGAVSDRTTVYRLFAEYKSRAVINFAAESEVDEYINCSGDFIETDMVGTCSLLDSVRGYWNGLPEGEKAELRFLHVSIEEVYGSFFNDEMIFTKTNRNEPNCPYAASKAVGDHLFRALHLTYCLQVLTTNCSNSFGSLNPPEKLIPLMNFSALPCKLLPVYGDGMQIGDWS